MSALVETLLLSREIIRANEQISEELDDLIDIEKTIHNLEKSGKFSRLDVIILYAAGIYTWPAFARIIGKRGPYYYRNRFKKLCRIVGKTLGGKFLDSNLFSTLDNSQVKNVKKHINAYIKQNFDK